MRKGERKQEISQRVRATRRSEREENSEAQQGKRKA